ncbi:MAG: type II toxin-antitoxin system Phd/YefM family antitoxin [Hyphomicrobiales bacterium]
MKVVNTHEAKTHLSRLLACVERGEEIVIARAGKPIARLVPAERQKHKPVLGTARGLVVLKPGWDDPMSEEELDGWYDAPLVPEGSG